jgi:hypothetical protein
MGGSLAVQLARSFTAVELRVTRDGVPLPGSSTDPAERVKQASYVLYFIAVVSIGLGVAAELGGVELLRSIGAGWASVGEGAVYGLLGWRTSKRSWIALAIGIVLLALDMVLLLVGSAQPGHHADPCRRNADEFGGLRRFPGRVLGPGSWRDCRGDTFKPAAPPALPW